MLALTCSLVQFDDFGNLRLLQLGGFMSLTQSCFLLESFHCGTDLCQLGVDFILLTLNFHLFSLFDLLLDFLDLAFFLASFFIFCGSGFLFLFGNAFTLFFFSSDSSFLLFLNLSLFFGNTCFFCLFCALFSCHALTFHMFFQIGTARSSFSFCGKSGLLTFRCIENI